MHHTLEMPPRAKPHALLVASWVSARMSFTVRSVPSPTSKSSVSTSPTANTGTGATVAQPSASTPPGVEPRPFNGNFKRSGKGGQTVVFRRINKPASGKSKNVSSPDVQRRGSREVRQFGDRSASRSGAKRRLRARRTRRPDPVSLRRAAFSCMRCVESWWRLAMTVEIPSRLQG